MKKEPVEFNHWYQANTPHYHFQLNLKDMYFTEKDMKDYAEMAWNAAQNGYAYR